MKRREKNLWFKAISTAVCSNCGRSRRPRSKNFHSGVRDLGVVAMGVYHAASWHTLSHICPGCADAAVGACVRMMSSAGTRVSPQKRNEIPPQFWQYICQIVEKNDKTREAENA